MLYFQLLTPIALAAAAAMLLFRRALRRTPPSNSGHARAYRIMFDYAVFSTVALIGLLGYMAGVNHYFASKQIDITTTQGDVSNDRSSE